MFSTYEAESFLQRDMKKGVFEIRYTTFRSHKFQIWQSLQNKQYIQTVTLKLSRSKTFKLSQSFSPKLTVCSTSIKFMRALYRAIFQRLCFRDYVLDYSRLYMKTQQIRIRSFKQKQQTTSFLS